MSRWEGATLLNGGYTRFASKISSPKNRRAGFKKAHAAAMSPSSLPAFERMRRLQYIHSINRAGADETVWAYTLPA
jgi:hypothetical protein